MAEWLLVLLPIVGVAAGVTVYRATRAKPEPPPALGLTREDEEELEHTAQRVLAEHFSVRYAVLDQRLRLIVARGVPPRTITPADHAGHWLLRFADGSEVPVTSRRPGDAGQLHYYLHSSAPVGFTGCAFQRGELVLTFDAAGRRLSLLAVTHA